MPDDCSRRTGLKDFALLLIPMLALQVHSSVAMFADRYFLSQYSVEVLNACVLGDAASFFFIMMILRIAFVGKVFVGQAHGGGKDEEIGKYIWQLVWLSLLSIFFTVPVRFF